MRLALATSLVLFLGLASALPAEELFNLEERAQPSNEPIDVSPSGMAPGTYKTVKCGKQTYDGHDIYLAAQHDKNRKEYPLVKKGPYNGGGRNKKQGDERVVFYYDGHARGVGGHPLVYYCGLMTHQGAAKGGFVQCPTGR